LDSDELYLQGGMNGSVALSSPFGQSDTLHVPSLPTLTMG